MLSWYFCKFQKRLKIGVSYHRVRLRQPTILLLPQVLRAPGMADEAGGGGSSSSSPKARVKLREISADECCRNDDLLGEASRALVGIVDGLADKSSGDFNEWLESRKLYWSIAKATRSVENARHFYRNAVKKRNEMFYSALDDLFDTQLSCCFNQNSYSMAEFVEIIEKLDEIGLSIEDKEDYILQKLFSFLGNMVITTGEMRRKIVAMIKTLTEIFLEKSSLNIEKHCSQKHKLELLFFLGLDKIATLQAPISPPDIYPSSLPSLNPFDINIFEADLSGRYKPIVSHKENFPIWLNTNKRYWGRLRRRNAKMNLLNPDDRQKVLDKFMNSMDEYTNDRLQYDDESNYVEDNDDDYVLTSYSDLNSSAKAFYDSFDLYYTPKVSPTGMPNPYIYIDVNLKIVGFEHIKKHLSNYHPGEVVVGLPVDRQDRQGLAGNPCYAYTNSPLPGWTREVLVRMNGQRKGSTDIVYLSPIDGKRVRSKIDMQQYLTRHKLSAESYLPKFDFHGVFCVCHKPEEAELNYLECSFGKGGCNGWLHTDCIGLGKLSKFQIEAMPAVVCPLCVLYLEGTGEEYLMNGNLVSREITCQVPPTLVYINGLQIKETARKHELWGIEGSKISFGVMKQRNPVPTFNSTISYSEKVRYEVEATANKVSNISGSKPRGRPPNNPNTSTASAAPPTNATVSPATQIISSTPSTPVNPLTPNLPPIFQHRLLAHFLRNVFISDTNDNGDRNILKDFEHVSESGDDQSDDCSYEFEPKGRTRIVRRDNGSINCIGVTGGFIEGRLIDAARSDKGRATVVDVTNGTQREIVAENGATLSSRYNEDIIETAISFCYPAHRKKLNIFNTFQQQKHVYNLEKPLINLLPCEDGGLRAVCISSATTPKSLHLLCIDKILCAYCVSVVADEYKSTQESKKDIDKKGSKMKRKRLGKDEIFSQDIDRAFKLVDRSMGAVTYSLHPQCNDRISVDMKLMNAHIDEGSDPLTSSHLKSSIVDVTTYLTPSDFYEYDEVDEVICDLCGRCGGIIQFFDLANDSTSLSPPSSEGWMAHPFCIHWLSHSGLLEPRVAHIAAANDLVTNNLEELQYKSAFDKLMDNWRCSLCSLHVGIVIRCSALGCAVRAHPLCVSVAGERQWTLCSFAGLSGKENSKSPGFLCSAHSKQELFNL